MNTFQRLYTREFVILLLIVSALLSLLFSIVSMVEKMDELSPLGISAENIILISVARVPGYLGYLLPMAALLCSIFVLGLASRRNEITVIKASGENIRRLLLPFIISGFLLIPINIAVSEIISPFALKESVNIINSYRDDSKVSYREGNIWFRGNEGVVARARLFIPDRDELLGLTIFYMEGGRLSKRIEAERGVWTDAGWLLHGIRLYDIEAHKVSLIDRMPTGDIGGPDVFRRERERLNEMGVLDLIRYERRLREAGYRNVRLNVDIQSRMAYPFTNLFMVFIGAYLSLKSRKGKGILSAGTGILISLIYWFLFTFSLSMGYAGLLPPAVSAWALPVLSAVMASTLYLRIPL